METMNSSKKNKTDRSGAGLEFSRGGVFFFKSNILLTFFRSTNLIF